MRMSEKKYVVPEGMLDAALVASENPPYGLGAALEAAIRWQSENPIEPTPEQCERIAAERKRTWTTATPQFCADWISRMYLAELKVPEAIQDLMWSEGAQNYEEHNEDVVAAYCRGMDGRKR